MNLNKQMRGMKRINRLLITDCRQVGLELRIVVTADISHVYREKVDFTDITPISKKRRKDEIN